MLYERIARRIVSAGVIAFGYAVIAHGGGRAPYSRLAADLCSASGSPAGHRSAFARREARVFLHEELGVLGRAQRDGVSMESHGDAQLRQVHIHDVAVDHQLVLQLPGRGDIAVEAAPQRRLGCDARTFRRRSAWCWDLEPRIHPDGVVHHVVMADGTYVNGWCLLTAVDGNDGEVLAWQ